MTKTLYLDLETFSETPITNGVYKYAEKSEILLLAYALEDDPVTVLEWSEQALEIVKLYFSQDVMFCAHNSNFDRVMLKQHDANIPIDRWHDTMVQALAHSLPGSLGMLCDIFKVPVDQAKDKEGKKLINLFCKPQKNRDGSFSRVYGKDQPELWQKFKDYAALDISAMRVLHKKMPKWNLTADERKYWIMDQERNDRGFKIDLDLANACISAIKSEKTTRDARTKEATNNEVNCATQRDAMLEFILKEYGVSLPDMQVATLTRRLEDPELPEEVKELISLRLESSGTSTKKYTTLINATCADGRMRGTVQFCGAGRTGRDCVAEGSLVTVLRNDKVIEIPIENVLVTDKVWDGQEWVLHDGIVFSGKKEIIEHDNILATSEHKVYISSGEKICLGLAKKKNIPLWPGDPVKV